MEEQPDDFDDIYDTTPPDTGRYAPSADANPNKRKLENDAGDLESSHDYCTDKRQKTVSPANTGILYPRIPRPLPGELWQYIFQYLPVKSLISVLSVSHKFNTALTSADPIDVNNDPEGGEQPVPSEEVWHTSRQLFHPSLPSVTPACGERALWKLLSSDSCQYCNKKPDIAADKSNPWSAGPGTGGVSIVWPFAIRSCGPCLRQRVQTDSSLMFSDFSAVLPAAPFAFMTKVDDIVSPSTLRSGAEAPATAGTNKVFFMPNLEIIQANLQRAQGYSAQAAGDLYNALKADRAQKLATAEAWEQWDAAGGVQHLRANAFASEVQSTLPIRLSESRSPTAVMQGTTQSHDSTPYRPTSTTATEGSPFALRAAPSRNANTYKEGKALRRADIERRCGELVPPISPALLNHMESFQAAMQIGTPLNDNSWNMLKPRLVAQFEIAQQREDERQAAIDALRTDAETTDTQSMDPEQWKDRWDIMQKPIRKRLSSYVDEIVRTSWADGRAINFETSPRFAADALIYVRNRHASDMPKTTTTDAPGTRLCLENMKWIYDNKVKPLTEHLRKDLFLCAGCGSKSKYFAFDSIIQHYAAKHTNTYSAGQIVVAWHEALWPEQPPFQTIPDPDSRRKGLQTPYPRQSAVAAQPPGPLPGPQPIHAPNPAFYADHMSSPPPYGQPHGPFASPGYPHFSSAPHYPGSYSHHPLQPSVSPAFHNQPGYMPPGHPGHYGATSPFDPNGYYHGPNPPTPASSHGGWGIPPFSSHPPTYAPSPAQGAPNFLQQQSDAVARISREVWDTLSPVKPIHPSVRMYVLIHQVVSRFQTQFPNEPNLDLFAQCLVNQYSMRPMKDVNGLACKTCVVNNESHEESHSQAFHLSSGERKLYPFLSLLSHFKNVHIEHALALENAQTHETAENLHRLDWKEDMIELPGANIIAGYAKAAGMDRGKFELLRETFPGLPEFVEQDNAPIPVMPTPSHGRNISAGFAAPQGYNYQSLGGSTLNNEPFIKIEPGSSAAGAPVERYSPSHADEGPAPRDDEYDPRRPAFIDSRPPPQSNRQRRKQRFNQLSQGSHPNHGTSDHPQSSGRQAFDRREANAAPEGSDHRTDPGLAELLQTLTSHQAAQAQAKNTGSAGSHRSNEQAETFLRDFVPLSEPREQPAQQPPLQPMPMPMHSPPGQGAVYPGHPQYYGQNPVPVQSPYHGRQPQRSGSLGGPYDGSFPGRPAYVMPDQQYHHAQPQYAQYEEEPVEVVYVRRRDAEQFQQFQGYR